jgi:hypothetical protein
MSKSESNEQSGRRRIEEIRKELDKEYRLIERLHLAGLGSRQTRTSVYSSVMRIFKVVRAKRAARIKA